jgi:hypothetical protein
MPSHTPGEKRKKKNMKGGKHSDLTEQAAQDSAMSRGLKGKEMIPGFKVEEINFAKQEDKTPRKGEGPATGV